MCKPYILIEQCLFLDTLTLDAVKITHNNFLQRVVNSTIAFTWELIKFTKK